MWYCSCSALEYKYVEAAWRLNGRAKQALVLQNKPGSASQRHGRKIPMNGQRTGTPAKHSTGWPPSSRFPSMDFPHLGHMVAANLLSCQPTLG